MDQMFANGLQIDQKQLSGLRVIAFYTKLILTHFRLELTTDL